MLYEYILQNINEKEKYYIFIDEIQLCYKIKKENIDANSVATEDRELLYTSFYDILNDLMARKNLDIYVTGSNSRLLSKDVATNFRDRGCEIQVFPLSFSEFYEYSNLEKADAFEEYMTYGGMPLCVLEKNEKEKAYLDFPLKYYAVDLGLRNARLNFRQQERSHIMENIIYNELIFRGFSVDVGLVQVSYMQNKKQKKSNFEIDFVVNQGFNKIYIQSAFNLDTEEKKNQEIKSLVNSGDFFKKIIIVNGNQKCYIDENGIIIMGVIPFLLDKNSI